MYGYLFCWFVWYGGVYGYGWCGVERVVYDWLVGWLDCCVVMVDFGFCGCVVC